MTSARTSWQWFRCRWLLGPLWCSLLYATSIRSAVAKRSSSVAFVPFHSRERRSCFDNTRLNSCTTRESQRQALMDWMEIKDLPIAIKSSTLTGTGDGLFVSENVCKGTELFEVPPWKILCIEDAWEDEHLGEAFSYLTDQDEETGSMVSLIGKLAKEFLLAFHGKGENVSPWDAYLQMQDYHASDHVLWWSDEDVERLTHGSNVYENVQKFRQGNEATMEILCDIFVLELEGVANNFFMEQQENWPTAIRAAYGVILSRAFQDSLWDWECTKCIPLLDMAQHAEEPNVVHVTDENTDQVLVTACKDLQAGDEIFINYAPDWPPEKFFPPFGFAPNKDRLDSRKLFLSKNDIFFPNE